MEHSNRNHFTGASLMISGQLQPMHDPLGNVPFALENDAPSEEWP